ncbi:hypothetical protein D3C87_1358920 [compost metagenome]
MTSKIIFSFIFLASVTACASGSKRKATDSAATTEANKTNQGAIVGVVKDAQNKPLESVVIVIANTTARGPIKESAPLTNSKGEFSLSNLPPGEYTLRASPLGYTPKNMKVIVEETKTSSVDFIMTK